MAWSGRLLASKRVRSMDARSQCKHYISQTMFVVCVLILLSLTEHVLALPYNKEVVYSNKRMNFGTDDVFGGALRNSSNDTYVEISGEYRNLEFETGEILDESNSQYDERRWMLSGVDLILRFEKGYAFCPSYVVVPAENVWPVGLRAFLYLIALVYLFLGVAIVSDVFMAGIEEITAEKEKIVLRVEKGEEKEVSITYTVWNETVANLTLLALGSSAPEILLSVVETGTTLDQVPGELGPSTIVGSAAFNLLVITGICMLAVEEVKKIKEFGVFLITSATSLFAYLWMLVVLQFNSPDVVEVWEAILTLLFFPTMVLLAWAQDRNWFRPEGSEGSPGASPQTSPQVEASQQAPAPQLQVNGGCVEEPEGATATSSSDPEPTMQRCNSSGRLLAPAGGARRTTVHRILEAHISGASSGEVTQIINAAKANHGKVTEESIREELEKQRQPKKLNSGHYRMNAMRAMLTKKSVLNRIKTTQQNNLAHPPPTILMDVAPLSPKSEQRRASSMEIPDSGVAAFDRNSYSVLEGEGHVVLTLVRRCGSQGPLKVAWRTADLTAMEGQHYHGGEGVVSWKDGDAEDKEIKVGIIDNDIMNPDLLFTVKLEQVHEDGVESHLGIHRLVVITIVDDDHAGELRFNSTYLCVPETAGVARVEVIREKGVTGSLMVSYKTSDGLGRAAAIAEKDYTATSGSLLFGQGDTSKFIEIPITDGSSFDREDHFFVTITDVEGKAGGRIGSIPKVRVIIQSDSEVMQLVEEVLMKVKDTVDREGTWGQQFRDALNFGPDEEGERPSNMEYLMHFLTMFWKVLFSVIPPPTYGGGFPTFCVSLFMIGLVTAMVAEIAGLVGCTMGLKDQVTAITFVALGTSLPDTFASKQAVEQEEYADAAVGNVTGSNSVNVFLGLGLPWTVAAIYYEAKGECYIVPSGALSFSVLLFTVCAVVCIVCLLVLRATQGGEIGGKNRKVFAGLFFTLWFVYILVSSLNVYGHLSQFPGTENRCPCSCANRGVLPWAREPASETGSCIAAGCPVV